MKSGRHEEGRGNFWTGLTRFTGFGGRGILTELPNWDGINGIFMKVF
jgi:hypothetical protein